MIANNLMALRLHTGRQIENASIGHSVYDWVVYQRAAEVAVSTASIISGAIFIHPNFNQKCLKRLTH